MHSLVFVLVPPDTAQIKEKVTELLSPAPERRFPDYPVECSCVGWAAMRHGYNTVDESPDSQHLVQQLRAAHTDQDPERIGHLVQVRLQAATEVARTHSLFGKPDPDCDICQGTGTWMGTRNPASHWDYLCIGGRWDGVIFGTPRRDDLVNAGEEHERLEYNCAPVRQLPEDLIPHAIVTPDGLWYEEANWASTEEAVKERWREEARALLKRHQNCLAIAVDCHF